KAFISADNAQPQQIFDTLDMSAANGGSFQLDPVANSVEVHGNYINKTGLSTSALLGNGMLVGTNALDGKVKGCFQQEVVVVFKVKVKMPQYKIQKSVHVNGTPGS